jgi:hypothetical protein
MGTRLHSYATAAEGLGLTGGFSAFIAGIVMASQTGPATAVAHSHPHVALGFAVSLAGLLFGASMMVFSRVVGVIADYVSVAHLVEVAEN